MTKLDDSCLDAFSLATGIPVPAEYREGVGAQLQRLAGMAKLVMDFPLSDIEESIITLCHE